MTRPDLAFEVNRIASEVPVATVKTLKEMNKIIKQAKGRKPVIRFTRLGKFSDLVVKVYTDASYNNRKDKINRRKSGFG